MAPTRALAVLFVIALAMVGCSQAEPEVDPVSQVPADQRPVEAGSEGGSEGDAGGGAATFVAVDIEFEEAPTSLAAGDVEITLTNNGATEHNVTFPDISSDPVVIAAGGSSESATVTLGAGTVRYICSVPGHDSLMNGEITVE